MITIRHIAISTLLSAVALQSGAWTLFGSKEDALADKLRSGDKYLQKADAAYEGGKMSNAGKYYGRAIKKYEEIKEADPTFMDGIAGIRLDYCAKQYTNALEAASAAEAGAADGAEVGAAGAAEEEGRGNREQGTGAAEEEGTGNREQGTGQAAQLPSGAAAQPPAAEAAQPPAAEAAQPPAAEAAQSLAAEAASAPQAAPPPKPPYDPRNFTHDFAEARMLMEDGNLSEAAAVLIPMLRHDPANRQVRLLLAIVRTRQSRYDEAIVALEDLRGIREDMPILLALSGAYMGAVRYHDALLTLDRAVRLNPADPNPYLNLAWLTLVMPQEADTLKNAEIYYRQAVRRGAARDRALETRIGLTKW